MKNNWRVILIIAALGIVLGGICFGVGILTGAETDRILQSLNNDYHLETYVSAYTDYLRHVFQYIGTMFA